MLHHIMCSEHRIDTFEQVKMSLVSLDHTVTSFLSVQLLELLQKTEIRSWMG